MKLETFIKKFDTFADAPDAVAKMRELVLELAVQGKLVAQRKHDAPASILLEAARAERAKFVAARKIKSRANVAIEPHDQPFALPTSWAWARLSDVGHELGQKVPDKRFTYIDVSGIDPDRGQISNRVEQLEPGAAPSRARKLVARGTVIYSTVRPYLLNIAIVDQDFDPEPIASTAFGILHPFAGINNRYLFYWLRSSPFTSYVQDGMKGMAYPAINHEKFYSGPIPLPPLAEQKRIVAKVDELMALCDRLEAQQQERNTRHASLARASLARFADAPTPANLKLLFHKSYDIPPADLRKSILTLAVQGKLVPQDADDEPAERIIDSLTVERDRLIKKKQISKAKKLSPPSEHPFHLPSLWRWTQLGSITHLIEYGTSQKSDDDPSRIPVYRMGDIQGGALYDQNLKFVPPNIDDLPRLFLKPGDILFNRTNSAQLVGKAAIFKGTPKTHTFASYLIRVRVPAHFIDPEFINLCFRAPYFRETQIKPEIVQQCGQANFNGTKLAHTLFPIPPLAEQRRIVAKVDQLMSLVDQLETQLSTSRSAARDLLDALVHELTKGKKPHAAAEV